MKGKKIERYNKKLISMVKTLANNLEYIGTIFSLRYNTIENSIDQAKKAFLTTT